MAVETPIRTETTVRLGEDNIQRPPLPGYRFGKNDRRSEGPIGVTPTNDITPKPKFPPFPY